jgi:hypothetical protein
MRKSKDKVKKELTGNGSNEGQQRSACKSDDCRFGTCRTGARDFEDAHFFGRGTCRFSSASVGSRFARLRPEPVLQKQLLCRIARTRALVAHHAADTVLVEAVGLER